MLFFILFPFAAKLLELTSLELALLVLPLVEGDVFLSLFPPDEVLLGADAGPRPSPATPCDAKGELFAGDSTPGVGTISNRANSFF